MHMQAQRPSDLIKVTAARKLMGVSPMKMAQLIKDGLLRTYDNPLDKRVKLVSRAEVDSLLDMREKAA
jgi:DNA-binding MarR family transcriptional regulator